MIIHIDPTTHSERRRFVAPYAFLLATVACDGRDHTEIEALSSALTAGVELVSVRKALADEDVFIAAQAMASSTRAGPDVLGPPGASDDFYVAIKKSSLSERWFLSAYMRQFYPGFEQSSFGLTLGTRVVSFATQNDRLYVFDASEQFALSNLLDPEILVEAYPIVHRPEFERLPGASDYVLFDPARGLNEFAITGNVYADPTLTPSHQPFGVPIEMGASFMQSFRTLADGAAFEQVFTGNDAGSGTSIWGTLGITLRRYAVGDGYVPSRTPEVPFFFSSSERHVPDSGGQVTSSPVRWNIYPTMAPIEVAITAGALRAQADHEDIDVLGALERGVESWNEAFGFEALRAMQIEGDEVPGHEANVVMVDYPGAGFEFAFADWSHNPENGEIQSGRIYLPGVLFDAAGDLLTEAAPADEASASHEHRSAQPGAPRLLWGGMPEQEPRCSYPMHERRLAAAVSSATELATLTPAEQAARFIQHVTAHEVGHLLGLRHNFKGTLLPPSSSVMDYLDARTDAVLSPGPQAYDRDAVRFLYGLSAAPPAQPFCTDEDVTIDPRCSNADSKAEPLSAWWQPLYSREAERIISAGLPAAQLNDNGLNEVLAYARDPGFVEPSRRLAALNVALGPAEVPIPAERLGDAVAMQTTNAVAEHVLRRAVLDPPALRGSLALDISDPAVIAALADQAGRMLANEDGIRSDELRRTAVDVLKRLQAEPGLRALRGARDGIRARIEQGGVAETELPVAEDLLARIDRALTPYFD